MRWRQRPAIESLQRDFSVQWDQSFRHARPIWAASMVSMALIPVLADTLEIIAHKICGTQRLGATIAASAVFTAISTLLELFAMRRGVLIVGRNSGSLLHYLRKMPELAMALRDEALDLFAGFLMRRRGRACSGFTLSSSE